MSDIRPAGFPGNLFLQQVTIPSGGSVSELIATQGMALVGIYTPENGWTDAAIGYRTCWDGRDVDLVTAYDNVKGYVQSLVSTDAAAASVFVAIPQSDTLFVPFVQLTSRVAGADTATNQAAARVLTLVFRNFLS